MYPAAVSGDLRQFCKTVSSRRGNVSSREEADNIVAPGLTAGALI
jgi:hypothetical protein